MKIDTRDADPNVVERHSKTFDFVNLSYRGYSHDTDERIYKAMKGLGSNTGSGYGFGSRDINFKVRKTDLSKVKRKFFRMNVRIKVSVYPWVL
jgi:hypothetical protein